MFNVTVESDLREHWTQAMYHVGEGCMAGVERGLEDGAAYARTNHRYKDRTGTLTASIGSKITRFDGYGAEGDLFASAKYASMVEEGMKAHRIVPKKKNKGGWLAWQGEDGGDWHFARAVNHPGTKPYAFMGDALLKTERTAVVVIEEAIVLAQKELEK